jgi:hypothetical protein
MAEVHPGHKLTGPKEGGGGEEEEEGEGGEGGGGEEEEEPLTLNFSYYTNACFR